MNSLQPTISSAMQTTIFHHQKFTLIIKKHFIYVQFKDGIYLYAEDTQQMYNILKEIQEKESKKLTLVINVNGVIGTTKASRDLGISPLAIQVTKRLVLVTDSVISKLMANFFMKVTPPPYPIRIVNSIKDGLKWLNNL